MGLELIKDETDELLRMIGERLFHRKTIRVKSMRVGGHVTLVTCS